MTRGTQGLLDGRDDNDGDAFVALWATAPLPRLPKDAPAEIKKFTIDIDDPKRIYSIHRATRRHHFQLLIERYIVQVRYGCVNELCTTSTCFSYRKRLAAGAPIRRYNSTSARTLAVYLSSQDNPEQGLCYNPSVPIPKKLQALKSRDELATATSGTKSKGQSPGKDINKSNTQELTTTPLDQNTPATENRSNDSQEEKRILGVEKIGEKTKTDHKSFVQNVFNTIAFKMLEWLTPQNLELIAAAQGHKAKLTEADRLCSTQSDSSSTSPRYDEPNKNAAQDLSSTGDPIKKDISLGDLAGPVSRKHPESQSAVSSRDETPSHSSPTTGPLAHTTAIRPSSPNLRRRSDYTESQLPKGILNLSTSPKSADIPSDIKPLSRELINTIPGKKPRKSVPGPKVQTVKANAIHNAPVSPSSSNDSFRSKNHRDSELHETMIHNSKANVDLSSSQQLETLSTTNIDSSKQLKPEPGQLPQSLSHLSAEIVDFICDILCDDDRREKHALQLDDLKPPFQVLDLWKTNLSLREFFDRPKPSKASKNEWRMFIEQSLFDVLSRPGSLLKSFLESNGTNPCDSHAIWYPMLRMTRVAPSLVFDSLWIAAGTLFQPPPKIESMYEWPKESSSQKVTGNKPLSNADAAQVWNICLHALIAIIPVTADLTKLANMSRTRSHGLTMSGLSLVTTLEAPVDCLEYDDAFTNDLTLRLARRLFAAIPTRRRFAELLELQQEVRSKDTRERDILEHVLSTLRFCGSAPTIKLDLGQRSDYESRVAIIILDWARTVLLQDWKGTAEVPGDGSFGGALAVMAALYKSHEPLLLLDSDFVTEYFADRLDSVEMPIAWLDFESNRKTVHLLDHPYLFSPSTLVTYFRAINYSRMNQAHETAKANYNLMRVTATESVLTNQERRIRLHNRLAIATARFMVLEISRENVLQDTFNSIWRREERELMRPLKIRLGEGGGEEGMDSGGVQQEFFRLAIAEALDPKYGTFTIDDRTKMTWFQPGSPEPLWKFELIGMIISLAVYNGLTLPLTFPKALYRKLLDKEVNQLEHIADGWPDLANGLTTLLQWDESDGLVEDVFARTYEFSVEQFGQPISREMRKSTHWPQFNDARVLSNPTDAPLVSSKNREDYVKDYIQWLTDISVRPQFEAFKAGFFTCVDRRSITLFNPETLQSLVEGIQEIDISLLRRATKYIGWEGGPSHRTLRDFWSIVKKYDLEQKKKLLEFVTASDRVPVGGIDNLHFNIQRNGVDDHHLPTSYTCYGVLLLPEYSSKEVLRKKLAMALENSKGFGFA